VFEHRRIHCGHEAVQVRDDLVFLHEAVRVGPVVGMPRQRTLPVRRDEAKRVPALVAPRVGNGVLFEHEMIDARLLEEVAHREPRLPAAHDDHAVMARLAGRAGALGGKRCRHDGFLPR
jgi:hypothetical protein